MNILKCETCGSPLSISPDGVHATCEVCGNVYEYKTPKSEYYIEQINEANDLRLHMDFEDAIKKYRFIAKSCPDDAEVYWGLLLSEYGIGFEKDPITDLYVPTFHRNKRGNILEHEAYKKALENATPCQKAKYEEVGAKLRNIQESIEKVASESDGFDVFISFKATDINAYGMPVKTIDRDIAYNIYEELTSHGVKTFFSEVTLMDMLASDYEAVIFNALNTCKVFILVGTSEEHINAVWVKNEWSRYRERLADDQQNGGISSHHFAVVGGDLTPDQLPPLFARTQNVMLDKYAGDGYKMDISASVCKLLSIDPLGYMTYGDNEDKKATVELEYQLGEDFNSYVVTGCRDKDKDVIIVPSVHEGLPVTKIDDGAFKNFKKLELIQLPDSIVHIGNEAFYNAGLTSISLPKKLVNIGHYAFYDNKSLTAMTIPASVKVIGEWAFLRCVNIEHIVVEDGSQLEKIGMGAFASCINMTEISLPSSVKSIAKSIFDSCVKLSAVTLPAAAVSYLPKNHLSVIKIVGGDAIKDKTFYNCNGLREVSISGVKSIGSGAFSGCGHIVSLTIGEGVESIGADAFAGCTALSRVELPNGLTNIGDRAFAECTQMTAINIPSSVTYVGESAFSNDAMLTVSVEATGVPPTWNKKWNAWKLFKKINAVYGAH